MNKPSSSVSTWEKFKFDVDVKIEPHVTGRIESRDQLIQELTTGTNDILFLIAHFDGKALYFGTERIDLKEIEALPATSGASSPRTAILVVCNAGRLSVERKSFFQRGRDSLGELLIRKGFFAKVVAPDHEIESPESLDALTAYLESSSLSRGGWSTLADLKPLDIALR